MSAEVRPSHESMRFVEEWLWHSEFRETEGQPWPYDYVRDAARMIDDDSDSGGSPTNGGEVPEGSEPMNYWKVTRGDYAARIVGLGEKPTARMTRTIQRLRLAGWNVEKLAPPPPPKLAPVVIFIEEAQ